MAISSRLSNFLALIAGDESAAQLEPQNELEYWLQKIAEKVNGGSDGGDDGGAAV